MEDLLLRPLADAFLQVGVPVPVAVLAAAAAWARVRYGMRALDVLVRHRRLAPLLGALLGVVPGCGTQIAFTGLYATGALPFPALLANAVAQDGDALLPVLAHDRRTAVVTTALTSVPALLAGMAFLVL